MWHWLDVHSNRLVQKEGLHGQQDKGRYEKKDKAGLWMTEEVCFLYQHNWEERVAEDFQWQLFSSLCRWLSDTRGMHVSSPAFYSEHIFLQMEISVPCRPVAYSLNELNSSCLGRRKSSELL